VPPGDTVFELKLHVELPERAHFELPYSVDNALRGASLNGRPLDIGISNGFGGFGGTMVIKAPRGAGLFVQGENTLQVTVRNSGTRPNPAGFYAAGALYVDTHVCVSNQCVHVDSLRGSTCGGPPMRITAGQHVGDFACNGQPWNHPTSTSTTSTVTTVISGVASVEAWNCTANPAPIHVLRVGQGYDVRELAVENGTYSTLFSIPFTRTRDQGGVSFTGLNACGLNPRDNIPYCVMEFGGWSEAHLVRIDGTKVGVVAKLPSKSFYSADCDANGTMHLFEGGGRGLYSLPDVDALTAYLDHQDARVADYTNLPGYGLGISGVADIVFWSGDVGNRGTQGYLVGITGKSVWLVQITGTLQATRLDATARPAWGSANPGAWGAGFNYNGQLYFSANSGLGIYELLMHTIDWTRRSVTMQYVGASGSSGNIDGFGCPSAFSPWTSTATTSTATATATSVTATATGTTTATATTSITSTTQTTTTVTATTVSTTETTLPDRTVTKTSTTATSTTTATATGTTLTETLTTTDTTVTATTTTSATTTRAITYVKPFNCSTNGGPIQVYQSSSQGFDVAELVIGGSGSNTLFFVPRSRTNPGFGTMNACGINPADSIAYCMMNVPGGNYLARFDDSRVEFVAKMPYPGLAGTFGLDGTYYMVALSNRLFNATGVASLHGFADPYDGRVLDLSASEHRRIGRHGSDIAILRADLGAGAQDHVVSLYGGTVRLSTVQGRPRQFLLRPEPPLERSEVAAAFWNYQNDIYFSVRSASGVYRVEVPSIDMSVNSVSVTRVGPGQSPEGGGIDGMNCMGLNLTSLWSGRCGPQTGVYRLAGAAPALLQASGVVAPDPMDGAELVPPDANLKFLPSYSTGVLGFQVYMSAVIVEDDGSRNIKAWHLACNLPCSANVCRPPFGLDSSLGGHFAWYVDTVLDNGHVISGAVWYFSLRSSDVAYSHWADADTFIDHRDRNYGTAGVILLRSETTTNPQIGFVRFELKPPASEGISTCDLHVTEAVLRLRTHYLPLQDISVYLIPPAETMFNEHNVTSRDGNHPGSAYPDVFMTLGRLVETKYGPVKAQTEFFINVTAEVADAVAQGRSYIAFGLTTKSLAAHLCAEPRGGHRTCGPQLRVTVRAGSCGSCGFNTTDHPACGTDPAASPGPLDGQCSSDPWDTQGQEPTCWRESAVTTTTPLPTTTTEDTTVRPTARCGDECNYYDSTCCPAPFSNVSCAGDQCCPDQSTCPSSLFEQAPGCNLKRYDCTGRPPKDMSCREGDEVMCPFGNTTCSGDQCCPDNSTCPSATVPRIDGCGDKLVDCNALLPEGEVCAVGEFVWCPNSTTDKCYGDQCCPDQSTCPSAPSAVAAGCLPKRVSCTLLEWTVRLRVAHIVFQNVSGPTQDEVRDVAQAAYAAQMGVSTGSVETSLESGSLIVSATVRGTASMSQAKLDAAVTQRLLGEETHEAMRELLSETPGLSDATDGAMEFGNLSAERADAINGSSPTGTATATATVTATETVSTTTVSTTTAAQRTVEFSMTVTGVDYNQLIADPALEASFKAEVVAEVADRAGSAVTSQHVVATLAPGSVRVSVVVTPPAGTAAEQVRQTLSSASSPLRQQVATRIGSLPNIQQATTGGAIMVSQISAMTLGGAGAGQTTTEPEVSQAAPRIAAGGLIAALAAASAA